MEQLLGVMSSGTGDTVLEAAIRYNAELDAREATLRRELESIASLRARNDGIERNAEIAARAQNLTRREDREQYNAVSFEAAAELQRLESAHRTTLSGVAPRSRSSGWGARPAASLSLVPHPTAVSGVAHDRAPSGAPHNPDNQDAVRMACLEELQLSLIHI